MLAPIFSAENAAELGTIPPILGAKNVNNSQKKNYQLWNGLGRIRIERISESISYESPKIYSICVIKLFNNETPTISKHISSLKSSSNFSSTTKN